jgi:energy-converting hydrogenase B subunit I
VIEMTTKVIEVTKEEVSEEVWTEEELPATIKKADEVAEARRWARTPGSEMSKIVRTMSRFLILPILIFGVYIIMHGHLTPGGGFQGGAVIASGVALLIVAFGSHSIRKSLDGDHFLALMSVGLLTFIGLAFAGMLHSSFFHNYLVGSSIFGGTLSPSLNHGEISSGGLIPFMDIGVGLAVAAGLSTALLVMARRA